MDVQGSRYHLLDGRADWGRCSDPTSGLTLEELWADQAGGVPSSTPTGWEYDEHLRALRLRRDTPLFRRAARRGPLGQGARRGAATNDGMHGDGSWYWITADGTGIDRQPPGQRTSRAWWRVGDLATACTCPPSTPGATFVSTCTCEAPALLLSGLAITGHGYLLAGCTGEGGAGVLVFDLHAGGAPLRLLWPQGFEPLDLAATADGGALVLDGAHSAYWRLDEHLRLPGERRTRATTFAPTGGEQTRVSTGRIDLVPHRLVDAGGAVVHPVSIEAGPGGSVLVLDAEAARGFSVLYCYDGAQLRWERPLVDVVEVSDPDDPSGASFRYSVLAHDLAFAEAGGPLDPPVLYVGDAEGEQVIGFVLDPTKGVLHPLDDFLPMRRWSGRALVADGRGVWYDFGGDDASVRWVRLQVLTQCRFAGAATLTTAPPGGDGLQGDTLDSGVQGCTWHRLTVDAHVPTGASVTVRARAADDLALLPLEPWRAQPTAYQRGAGSELPWTDPWADRRGDVRDPEPLPPGTGTYELLFQGLTGRHLQLEVTARGGGHATPLLRSLRAWFPRFSYVEHYLPAVYAEHDDQRFLERFLANVEGTLTALEERIEHSHVLLDPRTTRGADLPWLAAWFGLALDPQWDEQRRRFLVRHVDRFYRLRGTVPGLVATLRAYLDPVLDEEVFAGVVPGSGGIRVVERFLTRDTGSAGTDDAVSTSEPDPRSRVQLAAHRFDVLVPTGLTDDRRQMVERIVAAAKPAHTAFQVLHSSDLFVVGRARLGLDTELGAAPRFRPVVTGATPLGTGHLGHPHPFDLVDRVVSDRDRVGAAPAL